MGLLKIRCGRCNGTWEVYGHGNWKQDSARTCPHCFSRVDRHLWDNEILPAFNSMMDCNRELFKHSAEFHGPVFTVDYAEDHYFPQDAGIQALLDRIDEIEIYLTGEE